MKTEETKKNLLAVINDLEKAIKLSRAKVETIANNDCFTSDFDYNETVINLLTIMEIKSKTLETIKDILL